MKINVRNRLRNLGFEKEIKNVEQGLCPFCGKPIDPNEFRDEASQREYKMSGMCQACQDKVFNQN